MNKYSISPLLLAGLMLALPAAAETRVGFISMEKVMSESAPAVYAQKRLSREFEKRVAELNAMRDRLRDMKLALEKTEASLSEGERRQKESEWNTLNGEFQRKGREYTEDLNRRRGDELKMIQDRTMQVVRKIAENGKYDLIVQDALYHSSAVDLTPQVIKALAALKTDGK